MQERTVSDSIQHKRIFSVSPQASALDAARAMTSANCGCVLVIDATGTMVGIFTERDLMTKVVARALAPENTAMSDVMTHNPRAVPPHTHVSDAVLLMKECGFRHLPVISEGGDILGVFSLRDAMPREIIDAERIAEHLDEELSNVVI
jgi:signal-transduction protein with cAMP-binding, CBS, and nucleotidyltransferase domain